jgi:tetratricopeptide (TPR) repeat protein
MSSLAYIEFIFATFLILLSSDSGQAAQRPGDAAVLNAMDQVLRHELEEAEKTLAELCPGNSKTKLKRAKKGDLACHISFNLYIEMHLGLSAVSVAGMYWLDGIEAEESGQVEVAIAMFSISVDRDPMEIQSWHSLALAYRKLNDLIASNAAFRNGLILNPNDSDLLYWLATNYMDQKKLDESETLLRKALAADETYAKAWYRLGELEMFREDYASALELFKIAKFEGVDRKMVRDRIQECKTKLQGEK